MHPGEFEPAWWLPGPHAQTLGARLLRSRGNVQLRDERIELSDGDFVDLSWVQPASGTSSSSSRPLVVVLHGLEGSARSKYALEMYRALCREGLDAAGLNFRSCSGELNRLARLYHSGDTGDLAAVLEVLRERFPKRVLGAVGFSLGANVLLKYLGETDRPLIRAAAAISVPFDLSAGARRLEEGFSRFYRWYLVRRLKRKILAKASLLGNRIDLASVRRARTFPEFDDAATAPLHGFASAEDYYRRSSCARYLAGIRTPTLIIHSGDDPFLPDSAIPRERLRKLRCVEAVITERGGHVGFVSGQPWKPVFWAERKAAKFLAGELRVNPLSRSGRNDAY
ncbi:hypothetical protein HRbin33_01724 [bacterium HR33]|nr:hypothetical protein HRbin33_01724 [bacterium HR33]